jgi:hypothetical protein
MSQKRSKYKKAPQLIIGIRAARRVLGAEADSFSDEEIGQLIQDLDLLAAAFVKMVQNNEQILENIDYTSLHKSK